jgi:hypothetical protein
MTDLSTDTSPVRARFISQLIVRNPETHEAVELEIWQDPSSSALFGVDASFLKQVSDLIPSPYNPAVTLHLHEDDLAPATTSAPST